MVKKSDLKIDAASGCCGQIRSCQSAIRAALKEKEASVEFFEKTDLELSEEMLYTDAKPEPKT